MDTAITSNGLAKSKNSQGHERSNEQSLIGCISIDPGRMHGIAKQAYLGCSSFAGPCARNPYIEVCCRGKANRLKDDGNAHQEERFDIRKS